MHGTGVLAVIALLGLHAVSAAHAEQPVRRTLHARTSGGHIAMSSDSWCFRRAREGYVRSGQSSFSHFTVLSRAGRMLESARYILRCPPWATI